jgi:hypothetical protein
VALDIAIVANAEAPTAIVVTDDENTTIAYRAWRNRLLRPVPAIPPRENGAGAAVMREIVTADTLDHCARTWIGKSAASRTWPLANGPVAYGTAFDETKLKETVLDSDRTARLEDFKTFMRDAALVDGALYVPGEGPGTRVGKLYGQTVGDRKYGVTISGVLMVEKSWSPRQRGGARVYDVAEHGLWHRRIVSAVRSENNYANARPDADIRFRIDVLPPFHQLLHAGAGQQANESGLREIATESVAALTRVLPYIPTDAVRTFADLREALRAGRPTGEIRQLASVLVGQMEEAETSPHVAASVKILSRLTADHDGATRAGITP